MSKLFIQANYYYNFGFNVTSIISSRTEYSKSDNDILKSPYHEWQSLIHKRQSLELLHSYSWEKAIGLGVVLGYNDLRTLDIDNCNDLFILSDFLKILNLPLDYRWVVKSGSHNGFHILFYADNHKFQVAKNKIKTFRSNFKFNSSFKHIELRWLGHLVLPPSIHKSYFNYTFLNGLPLERPFKLCLNHLYILLLKYCSGKSLIGKSNEGTSGVYIDDEIEGSNSPSGVLIDDEIEGSNSPSGILIDDDEFQKPFYLFLDTETTGVPKNWKAPVNRLDNWPRLVQIAWILNDSEGRLISSKESIIKPNNFKIPLEASNVHGITTEYAIETGTNLKDILIEFESVCLEANYLIAHNINFDSKLIGSEFLRILNRNPVENLKLICTMESSINFCKIEGHYGYKWPKLSELHLKLFGENFEDAHNALTDIKATARCFWQLKEIGIV